MKVIILSNCNAAGRQLRPGEKPVDLVEGEAKALIRQGKAIAADQTRKPAKGEKSDAG